MPDPGEPGGLQTGLLQVFLFLSLLLPRFFDWLASPKKCPILKFLKILYKNQVSFIFWLQEIVPLDYQICELVREMIFQ